MRRSSNGSFATLGAVAMQSIEGEWASEASVTAVGLPIHIGEHAIGAINLVMQGNAVSEQEIATRYVPLLRSPADEISQGVGNSPRG